MEKSTLGEGPLSNLPADLTMWTIFSASNYSDGANDAAVLHWHDAVMPVNVHRFRTSDSPSHNKVGNKNRVKITELLCRRHHRLLKGFEEKDAEKTGEVNRTSNGSPH